MSKEAETEEQHLEGATPSEQLLDCARRNNIDLTEEILAKQKPGSSLTKLLNETRDTLGNTALHITAKYGSYEVMDILLDQEELDIDPVNTIDGDTPLHLAVRYALGGEPEHGEFVTEELLEAGADPRVRNKHGVKPVDLIRDLENAEDKEVLERLRESLLSAEFAYGMESEDEEKLEEGLKGVSLEDGDEGSASESEED